MELCLVYHPHLHLMLLENSQVLKDQFYSKSSVGLNYIQTLKIKSLYKNKNLFVALNRRYLSAVVKSKKIIDKINEIKFLVSTIRKIQLKQKNGHKKDTIKNWMYANSIHLVDLINYYVNSKIKRIENKNFLFKKHKIYFSIIYFKNGDIVEFKSFWNKPAPWKINIFTNKKFLQLKPIEKLSITNLNLKNSIKFKKDDIDNNFKPGFYRQCVDFKKEMQKKE